MISDAVNWVCVRPMTKLKRDIRAVKKIDDLTMKSEVSIHWILDYVKTYPDLVYVAVDGRGSDKIIGYIVGSGRHRIGYEDEPAENIGLVARMAVLHEYRRHGVGTMLMEALEYAFVTYRRYPMSMLSVRKTNEGAKKFYEGLGYRHFEMYDEPEAYEWGEAIEEKHRMYMMKDLRPDRAFDFNTCAFIEQELGVPIRRRVIRKAKKSYQRLKTLL